MERRIDLDRARREAKRRVKESGGKLSDAQLAVARELGEASWPRLVRRVEAEAVAREDRARQLVPEAADGRRDHAEALLALDPELGREGLDAALVLGEAERVRAALARDPGLAARPGGARDWLPLLYPCHSAFLGGERTDGLVECAQVLLEAGADPDSSWQHPEFGSLGALYGAAGCRPERTAVVMGARLTDLVLVAPEGDPAEADDYRELYEAVGFGEGAAGATARYVARRDGRAVGLVSTFVHGATAVVLELAVLEEHRRQGIGRALLARALQLDVTHVVLGPTPESIAFYGRLGFELRPALKDRVYYLPAGTGGP